MFTTQKIGVSFISMKITTLLYIVLTTALCVPWNVALAQSAAPAAEQQAPAQVASPLKPKRTVNPESIKRGKLTRLRKDVALTDDQAMKVKPIIDAYVNGTQAIKSDASLDSRSKRQKLTEARQKYDGDLAGVLDIEQQQKLASIKEERRTRLRAARAGKTSAASELSAPVAASPAIVQ
jgi:Spy/CpxP family protein refolding chaperone